MAALKVAGNSLEQIEALEIAGNTIMQDADAVSNALKVLSMRLRGTTGSALEEIGEDTEGLIEDFSKLNSKIKDLTKTVNNPQGVSIVDQITGGYKSTYQILLEISKVWEDIGDMQKAELLEVMAGKVRGAAAASILESPELLENAYADAMNNAAGAGERAVETSMESIEKRANILKNDLRQLAIEVLDSDSIKNIIDSLDGLINDIRATGADVMPVISAAMDLLSLAFKVLKIAPVGGIVGGILTAKGVFGGSNGLNRGAIGLGTKLFGLEMPKVAISKQDMNIINESVKGVLSYDEACARLNESMSSLSPTTQVFLKDQMESNVETKAVTDACEEQARATKALSIAQGLLNAAFSIGISIAVSYALRGLSAIIHYEENARKETREMLNALKDSTEEYKRQTQTINDFIAKYNEYHDVLSDTGATEADIFTAKQNMYDLQEDINDQYGITAAGLDLVNGKYQDQLDLLNGIENKQRNAYIAENSNRYTESQKTVNDRKFINELLDTSEFSSWWGYKPRYFLQTLFSNYGEDINTVTAQGFKDVIDNALADFTGNKLTAEMLTQRAGLSEEYVEEYQEMLEDLGKVWGEIINNTESALNNALDAENLIAEYEKVLIANDPGSTALYNKLNDYLKQLNEAYTSGDYSEYQRLYEITKNYLEDASHIIPYDSIVNNIETQLDNINTAYEKQVAQELAEAQDIKERAQHILNSKILGWENGVQNPNRQFTHMGYYGDPNYGAPFKWNEQEIKEAFEDLKVDTWEEINLFDDVIKEATEVGMQDINDLFDLYKKRLKELKREKTEVFDYTEWLNKESNVKNGDTAYTNNALIDAYKGSLEQLTEFIRNNREGQIQVDFGDIVRTTANDELFKALGMEGFEKYIDQFGEDYMAIFAYIDDAEARLTSSLDMNARDKNLLLRSLHNIKIEALGGSESIYKLRDSYAELNGQTDSSISDSINKINAGAKLTYKEMTEIIDKYPDLKDAVVKYSNDSYSIQEENIKDLINSYAGMSNEYVSYMAEMYKATIQLSWAQQGLVRSVDDARRIYREALEKRVPLNNLFGANTGEVIEAIKFLDELEGMEWLPTNDGDKGTEESKANLDWLEQYLEKRNRLVEEKNKEYENLMKMTMSGKNIEGSYYDQRKAAMQAANVALEEQRKAYQVAEEEYMRRMTSGVLYNDLVEAAGGKKAATALVNKIMAGESINLETMSSELSSAISAMVDNWNNKRDAAEKQIEIGIQIKDNDLAQKKEDIERIVNKYDRVLKEYEQRQKSLEHYQTMRTTEGLMQNEQLIIAQINSETKALASNIAKRDQLTAELKSFIPTTEDELNHWYDLKGQIDETTNAIYANQEAIASWQNEIKKLEWELDDKINQLRYKVTDEADFLINNLSSNDMYQYVREFLGNDAEKTKLYNGVFSDEGLATLGMHIVKRRAYYEEIKDYNKRIAEAEELYLKDTANVENLERLDTLRSEQRQIIENYNDEKQAVVDLVKEGYDKQLESLDALINKYMEALNAEKNLYDYQKNIEKQTKNIANLRKQMAAYANDTSEEARMKLQQLTVQLQEAEEGRSDTEYDRRLQDQQEILDRMYQSLEDYFNDKLENTDAILNEAKNLVRDNIPTIKKTLDDSLVYSKQATVQLTETMNNVLNGSIKDVDGSIAVIDGDVSRIRESVLKITPELQDYYKQYSDEKIKRSELYTNIENLTGYASQFNLNLEALARKFDADVVKETKNPSALTKTTSSTVTTTSGVKLQSVSSDVLNSAAFQQAYNQGLYAIYNAMRQRGLDFNRAASSVYGMPSSVNYNMSINLENVTDYASFIDECKKNKSFEYLIQSMTYNMLNSNSNSLRKYR